jgi:hypothetical protein
MLAQEAPKSQITVMSFPIITPKLFMEELSRKNKLALAELAH